jgi:hypothetical protein
VREVARLNLAGRLVGEEVGLLDADDSTDPAARERPLSSSK